MFFTATIIMAITSASVASAWGGGSIRVTPHDKYSSSIGVLGCKINTNRVAYWPGWPSCDDLCVRVTHAASGRSVHLLRIDSSAGAHDISYDAWNYLVTGQSASAHPVVGGGEAATWESAPMEACADLLVGAGGRLPLTAANSMNFVAGCPPGSWVGRHRALFNIANQACTYGFDEECWLDMAFSNQPQCPHPLGLPTPLTTTPVWDIEYGTGRWVRAV